MALHPWKATGSEGGYSQEINKSLKIQANIEDSREQRLATSA